MLHSSVTQSFSRGQISRYLFKSLLYHPLSLFASILWRGGAAWAWPISLQNPSLPSLIPCWGGLIVLLRRLNSLLLSKYYPSILWWGGFAYFLALLPYPPWFPSLLAPLPYHIILWRGAQLGLFPPEMLFYSHSFPLSSLTLLHFSLKVLISIYLFKSSL